MVLARWTTSFDVLELQDLHHGAEDLLGGDLHLVLHVGEDGRLDEIAFRAEPLAAADASGSLLLARLDVAEHLVELGLVDLRALLGRGVERVAELALAGRGGEPLDHRVIDLVLDQQPAAGAAALALIEEQSEHRAVDGRVEVGVGEDDVRALASRARG